MRPFCLLLALAGCNWISSADVEKEKKTLDEDGDGFVASEDCDDAAANVHPGAEDAWYDGVDSNCDGGNDDDQDGDGVVVPTDCDDTDAAVFPNAPDVEYDGLDSDCGGEDDYDLDGDGYVPDAYAGLPTQGVDGSGALPAGDCDDTEQDVHPGQNDAKYDGVDEDCGGNDDFDQDGDGHVPAAYEGSVTRYVDGSGLLPADDCDDGDAAAYPGATEIWYDGVNQDCADTNDYDQDGDGWVETRYVPEPGNTLPGGECDDEDPDVHPGGVETLGDAADGDCDGDPDSAELVELDGFDFADGHNVILVESPLELWLSVVSTQVRSADTTWYQAGIAFSWPADGIDNDDAAMTVQPWNAPTEDPGYVVTGAHAAVMDGTTFYGGLGLVEAGLRNVYLAAYTEDDGVFGSMATAPSSDLTDIDDLALVVDDSGALYAMACAAGQSASWAYLSHLTTVGAAPTQDDVVDAVNARACGLQVDDPNAAVLAYSDGISVWDWEFDPTGTPLEGANGDHITGSVLDIDIFQAVTTTWRVLASSSFGGVRLSDQTGATWTVGESGDGPSDADAELDASGEGVVAWVNSDGSVRLAIGGVAAGGGGEPLWAYYDVPTDLDVENVAVRQVGDTVVVAASGDDGVGIAILRL